MAKSIMQHSKQCFICGSTQWLEEHHVFGGANRKNSEKYGLKVWLCHLHHNEPPFGVHHNAENMLKLKQAAQMKFELTHSRKEFMQLFGKNYLD